MPRKDHFAALDVGSSTIAALVASVEADGRLTVRGVGVRAAAGIRRGFVAQVDDASASIRTALHEAARTSGLKIDAVYVALAGAHAEGINSRAAVTVTGPDGAVTRDDLHRAMEAATAMRVPAG